MIRVWFFFSLFITNLNLSMDANDALNSYLKKIAGFFITGFFSIIIKNEVNTYLEKKNFLKKIKIFDSKNFKNELIVESNLQKMFMQKIKFGYNFKNLLFFGRPGNGKTQTAHYLAYLYNRPIICVSCGDLIDSDEKITQRFDWLFEKIEEVAKKHSQSILFFDEVDFMVVNRKKDSYNSKEKIALNSLMKHFDRLNNHQRYKFIIIMATNDKESLDEALIRDGRVDAHYEFKNPNEKEIKNIFKNKFRYYEECKDKFEEKGLYELLVKKNYSFASVLRYIENIEFEIDTKKNHPKYVIQGYEEIDNFEKENENKHFDLFYQRFCTVGLFY